MIPRHHIRSRKRKGVISIGKRRTRDREKGSVGGIVALIFGILLVIGGIIDFAEVEAVRSLFPGMTSSGLFYIPGAVLLGGILLLIVAAKLMKK